MQSSVLYYLDINSSCRKIENYLERFEIRFITNGNVKETKHTDVLLLLVGRKLMHLSKILPSRGIRDI